MRAVASHQAEEAAAQERERKALADDKAHKIALRASELDRVHELVGALVAAGSPGSREVVHDYKPGIMSPRKRFGRGWIVCSHSLVHSDGLAQSFEIAISEDLEWFRLSSMKKAEADKLYISSRWERPDGSSQGFRTAPLDYSAIAAALEEIAIANGIKT